MMDFEWIRAHAGRFRRGLAAIAALAVALVAGPAHADKTYVPPLPVRVIYCSTAGVPQIADTTNPQAGPDGTASFQAVLNKNATGGQYAGQPLEIIVDIPILIQQVGVNSNTTIRGLYQGQNAAAPTGLWFKALAANSTNVCVLKNANWKSNYNAASPASSSLSCANIVDHDITIRDLFVDGQRRNGASNGGSTPQFNPSGTVIVPLWFSGVQNLRIENVYVYDPCCYHILATNIDRGTFRNLRFYDPSYAAGTWTTSPRQTDGLHLGGPWSDILIDGLFGTTGDDYLACNASNGSMDGVTYPNLFNGFGTVYYGHGVRLIARNLYPYQSNDVVRIQTGKDTFHSGTTPCYIDQIQVTNVVGSVVRGPTGSDQYTGSGSGGTIYRAILSDWTLDLLNPTGSLSPYGYLFGQTWGHLSIRNQLFRDTQGGTIQHQINLGSSASIDELEIVNYQIREDSGQGSSPQPAVLISQGTVGELIVRGGGWKRNSGSNVPFVQISGGTVGRVSVDDLAGNNVANLLSITGGTVSVVEWGKHSHRNAYTSGPAGGAPINIGTGVTLPLLYGIPSSATGATGIIGTSAGTLTTYKQFGT